MNFNFLLKKAAEQYPNGFFGKKEEGGIIKSGKGDSLTFEKLYNESPSANEFETLIEIDSINDKSFVGFWHTHLKNQFPSLRDYIKMVEINLRFKRDFPLIIIFKKTITIVEFSLYIIPKIKFKKF